MRFHWSYYVIFWASVIYLWEAGVRAYRRRHGITDTVTVETVVVEPQGPAL